MMLKLKLIKVNKRKNKMKINSLISILIFNFFFTATAVGQNLIRVSILDSSFFHTVSYGHEISLELKKEVLKDGTYLVTHPLDSTKPIIMCTIKNRNYIGFYLENYTYELTRKTCYYNSTGDIEGLLLEWYNNGLPKTRASYKNGELNGDCIKWHSNGTKSFEGKYVDGKLSGTVTMWNADGSIQSKFTYKNGKLVN